MRRGLTSLALGAVSVLAVSAPAGAAVPVKLVSQNSAGVSADSSSYAEISTTMSGDGRKVVFYSDASNLPGSSSSSGYLSFVRNVRRGTTALVAKTPGGDVFDLNASSPAISADGRYVAFQGQFTGGPEPGINQIWLRDLRKGTTRLVSKSNTGKPAHDQCFSASISANGRFIVFQSRADNLPGADAANFFVYIRDMKLGRTTLVSRTRKGKPAFGEAGTQAISSSRALVEFRSLDADLPGGDGSDKHIYLRDVPGHRTILLDRNEHGRVANQSSEFPAVSGNGRFVVFDTIASNLPGGDGTHGQVYIRNLARGTIKRVSIGVSGMDPQTFHGVPSGDGARVAFTAYVNANATTAQVYVRDLRRGTTRIVDKASNGDPPDAAVHGPSISLDGRFVTFYGAATNLGATAPFDSVFRAGPIG
jgi:Tol biopolymer transport system component